jgi:hypothetical protein
MNKFDEMRAAVSEAKQTLHAADDVAKSMAGLLRGRLRHCYYSDLVALKKELKGFNMHTGRWKP